MSLKPLVSIIIPTYNRAYLLNKAIESVLIQTYKSFEVIIVDDGSTDNTESVVKSFLDDRIVYIKLKKNKGRSYARNKALSVSRGKYIAFLDSDDEYLPGKLKLQVEYLEKNKEPGMVYTYAQCINDQNEHIADYLDNESGWIYKSIAFFRPITILLPTVMVRKEVFKKAGNFDCEMERFEDTDMWRRISKYFIIHSMPEHTCRIRTHDNNCLRNQNPQSIVNAIGYYTKKIINEDNLNQDDLKAGLNSLYGYYIAALHSVPHFESYAKKLETLYIEQLSAISSSISKISFQIFFHRLSFSLKNFIKPFRAMFIGKRK